MALAVLPTKRVIVTGTDLFTLASQYLGDATQWNRIAASNSLVNSDGFIDPFIDAATTVTLPPVDNTRSNGVLS